jgi:hypothetical protein
VNEFNLNDFKEQAFSVSKRRAFTAEPWRNPGFFLFSVVLSDVYFS